MTSRISRRWMLALALLVGLGFAAGAQPEPDADKEKAPQPPFREAPVTDVLLWAQDSIGAGFLYQQADLLDPATGRVRTVSCTEPAAKTSAERTVLLFELLRRAGLVAFEVEGLPGPTYQLVRTADAVRFAPVVSEPAELRGLYFASLALKLSLADQDELAANIRERLTDGVGKVEIFRDTHTLVVTDYTDRLLAVWRLAVEADTPAERPEDLVVEDLPVQNGVARRHLAALERLRARDESWQAAANDGANLVLVSGRRDEVERVAARFRRLDGRKEDPAFAESTWTLRVTHISVSEAADTLREMFAAEIAAGAVQIGGFERDSTVVLRGGDYDRRRAEETLKVIDVRKGEIRDED